MKYASVALACMCLVLLLTFQSEAQFSQQGPKLLGAGYTGSAAQGYAVSLSADGNTAILGAPYDNSYVGGSWVFVRNNGVWSPQGGKLLGTGVTGPYAEQGQSVSLSADGNTAAVGGSYDNPDQGAVWIFTRSGVQWTQQGSKLVGTGGSGSVVAQGQSVALSADGNTLIEGGPSDNTEVGAAWFFTRNGGTWSQQGLKLVGTGGAGAGSQGKAVAISADGNTGVVAGYEDSSGVGALWVYSRTGGVWTQQGAKLVGTGEVGIAAMGVSVAISADGNTIIAGGPADNSNQGATWVFAKTAGVWSQQSKLVGTGAAGAARQGSAVSISTDGNTAVVCGPSDNSHAGAAWIFTRIGSVWTQQGSKVVGTGGIGNSSMGLAVSLSADGTTCCIGGYGDNGEIGAVWMFALAGSPVINSIADIPNDQGGKVGIAWTKSPYDNALSNPQVTSYTVWRALPSSQPPPSMVPASRGNYSAAGKSYRQFEVNGMLYYWEQVDAVPAHLLADYGSVAPTYSDSISPSAHGMEQFFVSAETGLENVFYDSNVDSGYSVDNLSPLQPAGLQASVQPGSQVKLSWNPPTDPDVGHYDVYRSTVNGFLPGPASKIGSATQENYVDASPVAGDNNYYCIVAVDIHGNASVPSSIVSSALTVTQTFNAIDKWNMVSVPLTLTDYTKSVVYPTATSNAFGYDGSYVAYATLQNGRGYWLKFSGAQGVPIAGLLRSSDTVSVGAGWNIVGSISSPVATANITSIPGGMVSSHFFGYSGKYAASDTIQPGYGYWVKVNQSGRLVLSGSHSAAASARIQIQATADRPPNPPGENVAATGDVPKSFAMEQNYPNPFNPSTMIHYSLPASEFVKLVVYNMLGEEVVVLVNGMQDAGTQSVSFNAASLPSGIYTYRLTAGDFTAVKKMLLVK